MRNKPAPNRSEAERESPHKLPGTVVWLGVVSLLTDASGEMIYPLLSIFLTTTLGASARFVGLVEGVAETTASLLKIGSGFIADRSARQKPLTLLGYTLSSLARPFIALAHSPWTVLFVRFADRVGKGLRSSPRDALVAHVTPADRRGAAYGYHRAMDNAGAVIGPLVGYALLGGTLAGHAILGGVHLELRTVFGLAAIPAALAVASLVFGVREPAPSPPAPGAPAPHVALQQAPAASQQARSGRRRLWVYFGAVAVFTLGNSSDAFLILRARAAGADTADILLVWTLHNAVKALLSKRFGALSDRFGRRGLIAVGWLLYAATYLGFGLAGSLWQMVILFAVYGLYYALVEGTEKALVADLAGPTYRGRAFGWFNGITGLCALPASLGFSLLYRADRPLLAFAVAAALAVGATILLLLSTRRREEGARASHPVEPVAPSTSG